MSGPVSLKLNSKLLSVGEAFLWRQGPELPVRGIQDVGK